MIKWWGTAYRLHPLFVMVMVFSIFTGYFIELLTLFGIVLIHELGHVAAAKGFGWRVREVQLLPFGGVAIVDESSNVPAREELLVALFGPLQNAWMAGFSFFMQHTGWGDPSWWKYFLEANVMIGLFNLLPALPLDGGKVLQATLSYVMSFHRAMVYSAWISMFLSVLIVVSSLVSLNGGGIQLNLLVIGIFLVYSNWYGYKHLPFQFLRFLMNRERRTEALLKSGTVAQPIIVGGQMRSMDVFRLFMRERYHLIYITGQQGTVRKVLPEEHLIRMYFRDTKPGRAMFDLFMLQ